MNLLNQIGTRLNQSNHILTLKTQPMRHRLPAPAFAHPAIAAAPVAWIRR